MDTTIAISLKDVYGQVKAYPANEQATKLANLVGTKTLTVQTLIDAASMGFRITYRDRFGAYADMSREHILAIAA